MKIDGKDVLILHLKKQWWEIWKSGEKREEYRKITEFWQKRLTIKRPVIINIQNSDGKFLGTFESKKYPFFRDFDEVWLLCGYPKFTDTNRIIKLGNIEIKIREVFPEWGAPENDSVFCISGELKK